jgi:hypothetical protein
MISKMKHEDTATAHWKRRPEACITRFADLTVIERRQVLSQWDGSSMLSPEAVDRILNESPAARPEDCITGWRLMPDVERRLVLSVWQGERMDGAAVYAILSKAMPRAEADEDEDDE